MTEYRPFKELTKGFSPERRRASPRVSQLKADTLLHELRQAREPFAGGFGARLNVEHQANLSPLPSGPGGSS
jgi:hypothetical protein